MLRFVKEDKQKFASDQQKTLIDSFQIELQGEELSSLPKDFQKARVMEYPKKLATIQLLRHLELFW